MSTLSARLPSIKDELRAAEEASKKRVEPLKVKKVEKKYGSRKEKKG